MNNTPSLKKRDWKAGYLAAFLITVLSFPTVRNLEFTESVWLQALVSLVLGILTIVGLVVAHYVSRSISVLWQVGKFIVVGGLNTFVDFGVLNLLILVTGVASGIGFSVFKGISFTVAVVNSYFWNKHWTFEAETKKKTEFVEFFVVSVIGLGINVGVASFVVNVIGAPAAVSEVAWANIGAFAAVAISLVWNFVGYKFFVFSGDRSKKSYVILSVLVALLAISIIFLPKILEFYLPQLLDNLFR